MLDRLAEIGSKARYWLFLVVLGLAFESLALFYQYVLEYMPCVLCIHVRIWVLGFILTALTGLFVREIRPLRIMAHLFTTLMMAGLLERAWLLLGTERGTIEGSCGMESGLPDWFALDSWFPRLFKVWEPCGYTPELLFGISMAEALVVMATALVLVSAVMTLAALIGKRV